MTARMIGGWNGMGPVKTHCDVPTDEERKTGVTKGPAKFHRWPRPVKLGDPCYCGERAADDVLVKVLN